MPSKGVMQSLPPVTSTEKNPMIKSVSEDSFTQFFFPKGVVGCILETNPNQPNNLAGWLVVVGVFLRITTYLFWNSSLRKILSLNKNHLERPPAAASKMLPIFRADMKKVNYQNSSIINQPLNDVAKSKHNISQRFPWNKNMSLTIHHHLGGNRSCLRSLNEIWPHWLTEVVVSARYPRCLEIRC